MATARGILNCNPLNIRHNKDVFQGEVRPGRDRSFKQFVSMPYGYRAAFVILGSYLACGKNTIEKIVRSWAPPTENATESYIQHVVQYSGVGRHQVLTANSGSDYRKIVAAMCRCECGVPANMAEVEAGFRMQTKIRG